MVMMKLISAKVPKDWADLILQQSRETGLTPSEIIREAIGTYLRKDVPDSRTKTPLVLPLVP